MIIGAHSLFYSSDVEADMAFFRDVLKFPHVDAGRGWLIFGLPPSEIAIHPTYQGGQFDFFLMVDDINSFVKEMAAKDVVCSEIETQRWGLVTHLTLPSGGKLGFYEPKHVRPGA
jgi:hypothetical protein